MGALIDDLRIRWRSLWHPKPTRDEVIEAICIALAVAYSCFAWLFAAALVVLLIRSLFI